MLKLNNQEDKIIEDLKKLSQLRFDDLPSENDWLLIQAN
jgi:hypothetical protein